MTEDRLTFPLSFAQRRLWFLDQLEPGNAFYSLPLAVPFNVPVNTTVLERSINEIVRRHEALRTVFDVIDGEPVQIVAPSLSLPLAVIDLRALAKDEQEAEATRLAAEMAQRPFDLAHGPLLRTALLRRSTEDHIFLLVMHHIISDGWSLGVFWRELVALYNAFYVARPSPLPDLPIQYADFAVWQRQRLQGEKLAELVAYWKRQLAGLPVLQLPTDRPRPAVLSYRGAFQELVLPRALTTALKALSQREGVTLFMTLLAVFTVLLQRYSGQDDIVVGSYVASRDRAELEGLIGFFVNSLVLRADLSGDPSFRTLLARVREMALDAYAHQELPFEKLVEELQPERDLSRNPLFQVSFQLFSTQTERGPAAETGTTTIEINRGMAIFDLAVNIWEGPDGLGGHIEYSTDLFDAATIARLAGHFRVLLKNVVANPDLRLSALPMLSEAEQRQLLIEWNATQADIPRCCIQELFEQQVERSPTAVAVVAEDRKLTYDALNRRANRVAHRLRALGIGQEALVAVCVERGLSMVCGLLGILKAGAAYVPLDPSYPPERLALMMSDSGAKILLAERRVIDRLPPHDAQTLLLDDDDAFAVDSESNPALASTPDSLCYVIYTSGSTGKPKGVMGLHRALINRLYWMWKAYPFGLDELVCQKTALSFVDSVWEVFGGLLRGIKTVVLPDESVRDPRKLVHALRASRVSRIVLVPSLLRQLVADGIDLREELPQLKYWTASGEALSRDLCTDFRQSIPHAILLNLYGSSEVAADSVYCDLSERELPARSVPIGRPIANTHVYVLDRHLNPVPIGVPGELFVGGFGLARGYHNQPALTAERFIANPFPDAASPRLYKTGDLVRYRSDGQLEFLSRLDHQVKIRGHRIELGEIETVLAEHPQVGEAVVMMAQGSDDARLVAYVAPRIAGGFNAAAHAAHDLSSRWQTVWNDTYADPVHCGGSFNIVGWNSSYTGEPIPTAEMREWVDQTVDRVLSFKPRNVLEVGCGSGLILLRVAPHCARYVATDFSRIAIRQVKALVAQAGKNLAHVELAERPAGDLSGLGNDFDLIILNSVIQYFPSADYLMQVLHSAVRLTAPDGVVFIGDVRSLPLLRAFHAAVELRHAPDELPIELLGQRVQKQIAQEKELVLDPLFFHHLRHLMPGNPRVTIDLKRGRYVNELTQFRYDVTLRHGGSDNDVASVKWLDWQADALTIDQIRRDLLVQQPDVVAIRRIPNARVLAEIAALEILSSKTAKAAGDLRKQIRQRVSGGINPENLWGLATELPYTVSIGLLASGEDGCFDVVLRRCDKASSDRTFGFPVDDGLALPDSTRVYVTDPIAAATSQRLVSDLRSYLQKRLPYFMVPASIVLIQQLPQTPNGKIDRGALPASDIVRNELANMHVPPRNRVERALAVIWAEVLNIDRIGVYDNFFELGGHSLLATQVVSRIRVEFKNEIPVRAIFEAPTIAALAAKLEQSRNDRQTMFEHGTDPIARREARSGL